MKRKIMVIGDSFHMRTESVRYAIELATRLDASLVLLMLLSFEHAGDGPREVESVRRLALKAGQALRQHVELISTRGIAVEPVIRIGNPRSELVKFLAESEERFHSLIWGGEPDSIREKSHWMSQVRDDVKSSMLVPFAKGKIRHEGDSMVLGK